LRKVSEDATQEGIVVLGKVFRHVRAGRDKRGG
jgi:hypothetical protein